MILFDCGFREKTSLNSEDTDEQSGFKNPTSLGIPSPDSDSEGAWLKSDQVWDLDYHFGGDKGQ